MTNLNTLPTEVLQHILTYSISFRSIIDLSLVCQLWRLNIKVILGPTFDDRNNPLLRFTSSVSVISMLIKEGHNLILPLLNSYIRNLPAESPLHFMVYATEQRNRVISRYIQYHYVTSFNSLIGWTILGYIDSQRKSNKSYDEKFGMFKDIVYPKYIPLNPAENEPKIMFAMSVYRRILGESSGSVESINSRTVLIITDASKYYTYRIVECYTHNINDTTPNFILLNELVESIYYKSEGQSEKPYGDAVRLGGDNLTGFDYLWINTKSKRFSCSSPEEYGYDTGVTFAVWDRT